MFCDYVEAVAKRDTFERHFGKDSEEFLEAQVEVEIQLTLLEDLRFEN